MLPELTSMTNTVLASPGKMYRSSMYSGRSGVPATYKGNAAWDVPSCPVMRMERYRAGPSWLSLNGRAVRHARELAVK